MKTALLLSGMLLCLPAIPAHCAPVVVNETAAGALLPPAFAAGDLTIAPVQAGFDYARRVFPGKPIGNRTPIFTCTFRVSSDKPDSEIGSRLVLRRMIGPQGQFVAPFDLNHTALQNSEQTDIYGFYNADVDPSWEWVDVDLDVLPAPAQTTSGEVKIDEIAMPAPGGEVAVNRAFTGELGTQFELVKIRRDDQGTLIFVLHEERPAAIPDLEIASFRCSYQGDTPDSGGSGGGGLPDRFVNNGQTEISFFDGGDTKVIKNLELELFETAPSLQNRAQITRQRLRFPLQKLRAAQTIAPLAPRELPGVPTVLGRAQNERVALTLEDNGYAMGDTKGLMFWAQATPADARRGLRWNVAEGSATFAPGGATAEASRVFPPDAALWHSDLTPRGFGETSERRFLSAPPNATKYELKVNLEGRLTLQDDFTRAIELPPDNAPQTPADDGEHSLTLRKVQRFSRPEDLGRAGGWESLPTAGVLLVFEKNPLLPGATMEARALDAEDDLGRALSRNIAIENTLFRGDYSRPAGDNGFDQFYSLVLGAPAPDARSLTVWLGVIEKASQVEKTTLEIKDIPASAR